MRDELSEDFSFSGSRVGLVNGDSYRWWKLTKRRSCDGYRCANLRAGAVYEYGLCTKYPPGAPYPTFATLPLTSYPACALG